MITGIPGVRLCVVVIAGLLAAGAARAQQPAKVELIGVTSGQASPTDSRPGGATSAAAVPSEEECRACAMTCRSIQDALERHNRWWRLRKIETVTPATLAVLVKKKLLAGVPDDPGQGPNTADHFSRSSCGPWVVCRVHTGCRPRPAASPAPLTAGEAVRTISEVLGALRQQAQQEAIRGSRGR